MTTETLVYRSRTFPFDDGAVWFELRPYGLASPEQPWFTSRVDLWSNEGPYATLSTNPEQPVPLPVDTFYSYPARTCAP
jgi:hypothetical protein